MRSHIAFDLDGVLIDFMKIAKEKILEIYGIEYENEDPKNDNYNLVTWPALSNLTKNEIWIAFREGYKEIRSDIVFPGATELLAKLYEKTNEPPLIITARPFDTADLTYKIVKKVAKKTPFNLVLKHPQAKKSQYLTNYSIYVEDRRRTALELSELGFIVPLVKTHYNNIPDIDKYPKIHYINGVHELIPLIDDFCY